MNIQNQLNNKRTQYIVLFMSLIVFAIWTYMFYDHSIDDAFITFKYAENVANGNGFIFQTGDKPVEGYSNLLWLLILSLVYKIGFPTFLTAKVLGLSSMLASGLNWFFYFQKKKDSILWLAGPLMFSCPLIIFWGVSGLELGLHCLLLSLLVQLALKRSHWAFLPASLLVLNRPEGIAIACTLFFILAVSDYSNKQLKTKYYLYGISIAILTITLLTLFRYYTFGYPLPNTYYAKTHYDNHGFKELLVMFIRLTPLALAFLWGLYESLKSHFGNKELTIVVGLLFLQAVISSSVDPVMNYMFRYLIPFLPLFIIIALIFITKFNRFKLNYIVIILTLISFGAISFELDKINIENRKIVRAQENLISWLNSTNSKRTISMIDMGRIPYYTNLNYNDTWGLVDEDIGQLGFNPIVEFLHLPDYFIFVGNLDKDSGVDLRLGRDRMIANISEFLKCYELEKAGVPQGADIYQEGYYYLAFKKKVEAEDIINSLGESYWQSKILSHYKRF